MKKVLPLFILVIAVSLVSCGYSKEDLIRAENEGYQAGFEEGYDLAKYESKGEIEKIKYEAQDEIDRIKSEYGDRAYEAGYEDGFYDGLDANYGESYHGSAMIEKDRG